MLPSLMPTILPPSVIGARLALSKAVPPTGVPPGPSPIGMRVGTTVLPAPTGMPSVGNIIPVAIRGSVSADVTAPSFATVPTGPTTGMAGSAGNAGQINGADSQVSNVVPPVTSNIGGWGPLLVLGLAIVGAAALLSGGE